MSLYKLRICFVLLLLIPFNSQAADNNPGADIRPPLGRVAMNYQGSIVSPDEVYAVTAYVLNLSGIIGESAVLDQQNLVEVEMPNRDGFIELIR